jgi:exosortase A
MTAVFAPLVRRSPWQGVLPAISLALAAAGVLYHETLAGIVDQWAHANTYNHAFLVPPIVAWLLWRDRRRIAAAAPQPAPWVLLPMALMAAVWMLGALTDTNALMSGASIALLVLCVPALAGPQAARAMLFPLLFAFFMVPVGDFMLPVLMDKTADFTVAALRLSGVPVYREANSFQIPSGHWSVVEACSGVRYLIASAMVGSLFAYLSYRSLRRRLLFVAVALVVPVLANWVRAYMIVMLGHLSGNQLAVGIDHLIYGWLFFGAVMLPLYWVGSRWADATGPARVRTLLTPGAPPSPARLGSTGALVLLVLALPPFMWTALRSDTLHQPAAPVLQAPQVSGWTLEAGAPDFEPAYREPSAQVHASYASGGRRVQLHLLLYRQQNAQRKVTGSDNLLVRAGEAPWVEAASRLQAVAGVALLETRLRPAAGMVAPDRLAWRTYVIDGQAVADPNHARLAVARERLLGRGDDATALVLVGDDREPMQAFLKNALPQIRRQLADLRQVH